MVQQDLLVTVNAERADFLNNLVRSHNSRDRSLFRARVVADLHILRPGPANPSLAGAVSPSVRQSATGKDKCE